MLILKPIKIRKLLSAQVDGKEFVIMYIILNFLKFNETIYSIFLSVAIEHGTRVFTTLTPC